MAAVRLILPAALAAAVLALAPLVVAAPPPGPAPDMTVSKHAGGPFAHDAPVATIDDAAKDLYFKVGNTRAQKEDLVLLDDSFADHPAKFRIRWFRGNKNITGDARAGDYGFSLKPGGSKVFRANVKPLVNHPGALCVVARATYEVDNANGVTFVYVNDNGVCG